MLKCGYGTDLRKQSTKNKKDTVFMCLGSDSYDECIPRDDLSRAYRRNDDLFDLFDSLVNCEQMDVDGVSEIVSRDQYEKRVF